MSEKNSGFPKDPNGWVEHLKGLDPRDHKKAMVALGAAAAVIGAGVYAKKRGGKFFIGYGDRRKEKQHIISVGNLEEFGDAVSLPTDEAALNAAGEVDFFAMGRDGFSFYKRSKDEISGYMLRVLRIRDLIVDRFSGQTESPGGQTGTE